VIAISDSIRYFEHNLIINTLGWMLVCINFALAFVFWRLAVIQKYKIRILQIGAIVSYILLFLLAYLIYKIDGPFLFQGKTPILIMLALILNLLSIYIDLHYKVSVMTGAVSILNAILILFAISLPSKYIEVIIINKFLYLWVIWHVFIAFVSYSAFILAFIIGLMYLLQEKKVRQIKLDGISDKLPALFILDKVNFHLIKHGFLLLTFAIISGMLTAWFVWRNLWEWDPHQTSAFITWSLYAILFRIRQKSTLRGKKVALLSVLFLAMVAFTFIGVEYFLTTKHNFLTGLYIYK